MATTNNEQNPNAVLVGIKDAIDGYHRIPHTRHIPAGPTEQEDAGAGA